MNVTTIAEPVNPLFVEYGKDHVFRACIHASALLFAAIALFGFIFNISVCYVTVKYRRQYETLGCNTGLLIALNSMFEAIHQCSHLLYLAIVLCRGTGFLPFRTVMLYQAIPLVGIAGATCMLLTLSVDRLLAILMPVWYHNLGPSSYISAHLLAIFCFIIYYFYTMIHAVLQFPGWMMTGGLGDLFGAPGVGMGIYFLNVAVMGAAIGIYVLVGIFVKCRINVPDQRLRKMYRSLFLIVCLNVGGYFVCNLNVALVLLSWVSMSPMQLWYTNNLTAIGLNVAAGSNAPILFLNSKEYRSAYLKEFYRIRKLLCPGNRVQEVENYTAVQQQTVSMRMIMMRKQLRLEHDQTNI